ncbi:DUF2721 domain-containing protein [Sphingomonas gilva]|uniref:DUF2721 domain-containing protein n=1 Tax=Sphingomonas gilva TaxID=2305907 RepID=A0A396S571_9SPHN|nr:DUF2721 domain-containing protein [Sphingomonas gilva]RHW18565.1 DUF2721 domain-containing protein [Sphingomonas gilva]
MLDLSPEVTTIAQTIQLSVAPVFLLAGIGAILNMLAGRLARVVDRSRALERLHPQSTGPEHDRHVFELRMIDRRITIVSTALVLCVSSAIMVCLVVALLFVAELAHLAIGTIVAVSFVLAMLLLTAGLGAFLLETRISVRTIHVREELLERGRK